MLPDIRSLTAVAALTFWEILLFCEAKPFLDMSRNVASGIPQSDLQADNRSSNEPGPLLAVHQDLHPVLLPAPDAASNASALIPQPIATDAEMGKAIALQPVDISLGHSNSTLAPLLLLNTTINPNATKLEELMDKIKQPIPDPNSTQIQPKGPAAVQARDLLPSIVAHSNKETSSDPVVGSGVPPAAVAQAEGKLPKELMVSNPFGDTPAVIPMGKQP